MMDNPFAYREVNLSAEHPRKFQIHFSKYRIFCVPLKVCYRNQGLAI